MTSISRIPPVVAHGEFDFLSMLQAIWRQKKLIAASALIFGVLGAVYAFMVTPEYEVSTVLRPAALNELDSLNRSGVYSLPPGEALIRVGAALDSYETRLGYFRSNQALQDAFTRPGRTAEQAFEDFNRNALKLVQPDPKKADLLSAYIGVEMRYPKGVSGHDVLNGLVQFAIESERRQVSEDLKVIVINRLNEVDAKMAAARADYVATKEGRIAGLLESDSLKRAMLQDELRALRVQLKMLRENRISLLDEAIVIARSLGLKKPTTPSSMSGSDTGNVIHNEVNNQQIPLYFMGADALEAERQVLRKRGSDDFADPRVAQIRKELLLLSSNRQVEVLRKRENEELFLNGVEALRAERTRLEGISTDMSRLRMVSIDRLAVEPVAPVKPKKLLLVALGVMLGGLIGVLLATLRNALTLRRLHHVQSAPLPHIQAADSHSSLPGH
ncbi:Wzz/FepE/Etk N-terminal domain-containing protein [Pseudomonas qingdaonensis]|uniref:Wzz/FepE/Etk N-terminal domain-containing protein n=1 Tax=Pseudomonas qingdaonensis TaxID=2056231 RepID=UPI00283A9FB8|nr:Wzz/FepE/Etk N-terminal domain-containing protein [Pseudomonas qingdaonensis]